MRVIELEGTRAQYERIKLLKDAESYGLSLDPEQTAPFTVVWNPSRQDADIVYRQTVLAEVHSHGRISLRVREAFPEDKQFALLRALRNVTALTDQIGSLKRAEKAAGKTATAEKLFTNQAVEPFQLPAISCMDLFKSLHGAGGLNKKVKASDFDPKGPLPETVNVTLRNGNSTSHVRLVNQGGVLTYETPRWIPYHLKRDAFIRLLADGRKHWDEVMDRDKVDTACRAVIRTTDADEKTIAAQHCYALANKGTSMSVTATCGHMSMDKTKEMRFHGILLGEAYNGDTINRATKLIGADPAWVKAAIHGMSVRLMAAQMGRSVFDFPTIQTDRIRDLVDEVDYGYEM